MKRVLVFQHVPHENLGTLEAPLKSAGFDVRYVDFAQEPNAHPSLEGHRGLVVMGGPMNVDETQRYPHLSTEVKLIDQATQKELPVLGICLGAQLIAKTLGAKVYPNNEKEIGWYDLSPTGEAIDDPLFKQLAPAEKVFQWHGDTFDIPKGAVHLASSPLCVNQAFRFGHSVYALQFHLEVDETMIDRWLNVPENQAEIANLKGKIDPDLIRGETLRYIDRLKWLEACVFGEFIKLFDA